MPEIEGISAGGMPDRVKCLHVLAAHALAAGPGRQPARRRGARPARRVVGVRTVRQRAPMTRRGHRLRHQHDQAAGRRPARRSRVRETPDGPARPGGRPHRPARRRGAGRAFAAHRRVRRADRRPRRRPDAVLRDVGDPRRREPPRSSPTACGPGSGSTPRCSPVTRRRRSRSTARSATWRARSRPAGAGRRHRRRLDRADPRRHAATGAAAATRWTSGRCGCTSATCDDPPDGRPGRRPASPTIDADARRLPGRRRRGGATVVGVAGTVTTVAAGVLDLPAYDRDAIDQQVLARRRRPRGRRPDRGDAGRGATGAAATCTPAAPT